MRQFEALAVASLVLPVDARVADVAARIWAHASRARRRALGDILIAATASANALPLATRNRRDFVDWTR
jgi:predicted nucleic acid-binding protein